MNELQVKVLEVTPALVKFNYDEMSAYAKQLAADYRGLTFDEETVKEGKKTVAELKKIQKSVNDFKIKTKKELTESVITFENQCKEIIAEFDDPINFISEQLEVFEAERLRVKTLLIESLISQGYDQAEIDEKFQTIELKKEWLNITFKEKDLHEAIKYELQQCADNQDRYYSNVELIKTLVELNTAKCGLNVEINHVPYVGMLEYKTMDYIKEAIVEAAEKQQASELAYKEKLEAEKNQEIAEVKEEAAKQVEDMLSVIEKQAAPVEVKPDEVVKVLRYQAKVTKSQHDALVKWFNMNEIEFKVV